MSVTFQKIYIEIHNICNLRCSFCPTGSTADQQMIFADFEKTLAKVKDHTDRVCLHILGEPLLHPDILSILNACSQHSIRVELTTNGLNIRRFAPYLEHPSLIQVNFSLQSFKDNFQSRSDSAYLESIFSISRKLLQKRNDLFIHFRLWDILTAAQPENLATRAYLESYFGVSLPKEHSLRQKKKFSLEPRLFVHFDSRFNWPKLSDPTLRQSGSCKALENHIGILADGTVVPCCLDYQGVLALGNIKNADLLQILNSPKANSMREGFANFELREELCQKCQYSTRFVKRRNKQSLASRNQK
jgi:radical SAM protein with 4Fe4S-binding SPASM domain